MSLSEYLDYWEDYKGGEFATPEEAKQAFEDVRGGSLDAVNPFDEDFLGLNDFGQSTFQAQPPAVNPANFTNPSAEPGGLRDMVLPGVTAPNTVAPQAAPVVAQPVAPAQRSTFDTSLLAPGAGIAQQGVSTVGFGVGQAEGTREVQRQSLGGLLAAAAGAVPSAAEVQTQQGLGRALRGNLAMAASARGTAGNRVAAQRAALDANAATTANVLANTAALRANEQATARSELFRTLEGIRAGDFQTAQTGLGLLSGGTGLAGVGAQVGAAQLSADTQTQLANLQSRTGIALGQLNADQATSLANLDAELKTRGMDDASRIAYLGAILQIDAQTMEGRMALEQLISEAGLKADAINAQTAMANAGVPVQLVGAGLGAAGDVLEGV